MRRRRRRRSRRRRRRAVPAAKSGRATRRLRRLNTVFNCSREKEQRVKKRAKTKHSGKEVELCSIVGGRHSDSSRQKRGLVGLVGNALVASLLFKLIPKFRRKKNEEERRRGRN